MVTTRQSSQPIINVQQFVFDTQFSPYESKQDLVKKFSEERNLFVEENFKLMQEVRKSSYASSSLLIVRERDNNTLKIVVNDQVEGSQVRIQMDRLPFQIRSIYTNRYQRYCTLIFLSLILIRLSFTTKLQS